MEAASLRLNHWMLSEFEAQNAIYLEKILEKPEVEIRNYPTEVIDQLREFTKEIIQDLSDRDPFVKKVYDSYSGFRDRAMQWSELTEKPYYAQIQGPLKNSLF